MSPAESGNYRLERSERTLMVIDSPPSVLQREQGSSFFASYRWPLAMMLACVAVSAAAFVPRFIDYLSVGQWRQSASGAFK